RNSKPSTTDPRQPRTPPETTETGRYETRGSSLGFERLRLARTVFGPEIVDREVDTVYGLLRGWGYRLDTAGNRSVRTLIAHAMLLNRSPLLADMDAALLERLRRAVRSTGRASGDLHSLQRALAALGRCEPPVARNEALLGELRAQRWTDVPAPWAEMACLWFDTSTLSRSVRMVYRQDVARMGRWLAAEHPQITEPAQWTRATCAAWVATVDRMRIGDYVERTATRGVFGDPMSPSTKDSALTASRAFFRDLQEWEWIPTPVRSRARSGNAPQHPRTAGSQPPRHRRRGMGQAAVGRHQPHLRGPAHVQQRPALSP
ncbi:hypothetical protein ACWGJY_16850, partial [Streptomyces sp. NPDC054765]